MIEKFAQLISAVFQPLLIPLLCVYLLLGHHYYFANIYISEFVYKMYLITAILTVALPILSFVVLYKWGFISDLKMSVRKERVLPTYVALIYYTSFYYLIRQIQGIDLIIISGVFSFIVATTIANIITSYWKISIHLLAITGAAGVFIAATEAKHVEHIPTIIGLIIIIGLVGWSRLYLKRHTPAQVYAGASLGFLVTYLLTVNSIWI